MVQQSKRINILLGILLFIFGVSVLAVSIVNIETNEAMLAKTDLSFEEIWRFEGALQWWRNTFSGILLPVIVFSMVMGISTVLAQPV